MKRIAVYCEWLGLDPLETAEAFALLAAGMCFGARMAGGGALTGIAGLCFMLVWLVLRVSGGEESDDQGEDDGGGGQGGPSPRPRGPRPGRRLPRPTRRPLCPPVRARARR